MKYHQYVFNTKKRAFVGKFEQMYFNETKENYDSWFQEDISKLKYAISLNILNQYNFNSILDLGCGKSAFTNLLKKKNNKVLGIDISKTAIKKAKSKYPTIQFKVLSTNKIPSLNKKFDLVVVMDLLSYIKNWKELINNISHITKYIFVLLFIPKNPIGFVKSFEDLSEEVEKYFTIITKIINETENSIMILAGK